MSLMSGTLVVITSSDHKSNNFTDHNQQAFYVAETGLLEAEKYLIKVLDDYPDAEQENELAIELMLEVYNLRNNLTGYYDWLSSRGIDVSIQEKDSSLWRNFTQIYFKLSKEDRSVFFLYLTTPVPNNHFDNIFALLAFVSKNTLEQLNKKNS